MSSRNGPDPATTSAARHPPRSWSLAARLTVSYTALAFALLGLATGILYWALVSSLDRQDGQFLSDELHIVRILLCPVDLMGLKQEAEMESAARSYAKVYLRILDTSGETSPSGGGARTSGTKPVVETPGMASLLPQRFFPEPLALDAELGQGTDLCLDDGRRFRLLAARAAIEPAGGPCRVVQVALDRTHEDGLLASYRRRLFLVLGVGLLAGAAVAWQVARSGIRPVADISKTASRIRSTTLHERLQITGLPAELSALALTFNEMLDRLEDSFDRLSRFSADLAHELRTPVTNLRGEVEVALGKPRSPEEYREVLGSCLEETVRLAGIIDSLLFLARAESAGAQIRRERVDVGRELSVVCDFYEAAASERGVSLHIAPRGEVAADVDRTLLQRALGNLVENSLAHTPAGGSVTLSAERREAAVRIDVADTGSGIAPEHLPRLFDRFYRVDHSRSAGKGGTGLGLAIVKSIAELHGGLARVESVPGQGTRVVLLLPGAAAPTEGPARPAPVSGSSALPAFMAKS